MSAKRPIYLLITNAQYLCYESLGYKRKSGEGIDIMMYNYS